MLLSKYNSIHYAHYINQCDLNYKYFLKSINETPTIDKITFELPTNKIVNTDFNEEDYQGKTLLKCYLALYFINLKMPYINCNKFKNVNSTVGTTQSFQYAYLQNFNNLLEKYQLLLILLNENDFQNSSIKNLTKFNTSLKNVKIDTLNFRLDIQGARIIGYKDILQLLFSRGELQKIKFKLNLVFKNFNDKMLSVNEFKNLFFMWNL